MAYVSHDFYCINCGKKTLPAMRNPGQQRERGHLKKLWCINCKTYCNCFEVRDDKDLTKFINKFKAGDFLEMAKESLEHCGG